MSIVKMENITKKFGDKIILNNFSLDIQDGELLAVTGASGSGKSTILNIIGLLEGFDSGKLILDGDENIKINSSKSNKILREKIGYLFQNFALVDEETVYYNLHLALKYVKKNKKEKDELIKNVLKQMNLEGYEKRKIFELSGGEQQRVSIARLLLKPSKIILADEPTGSLDAKNRDLVLYYLNKLNKEGKTVIVVTHDMEVAKKCHRTISLN
ncbi:ABC transporter ATP-binding protein [Clostridium tetani]|uniref:Transporter n=1 Tax=Clostridium tetani (strain Massachusetts / E88) TaxID=212717 RepID=Q892J8_CLOTE|nr:ABC transporter ATP-binding protein [Clostridium tetani]AAO36597.1 transporter [Clostridium tetani E88]QBD87858.1 ABC transporter ATP-binding protein [Clostridium tetani]RXI47219.1 ATP-binding cassette domain-containing protein [Clostridium tetani]RXI57287.1 ATP-binding cassette domain-containing protein [Clostridium tetani]RXI60161.1 ATP-binding cassette domain-containing protein [Clostridium tetani]